MGGNWPHLAHLERLIRNLVHPPHPLGSVSLDVYEPCSRARIRTKTIVQVVSDKLTLERFTCSEKAIRPNEPICTAVHDGNSIM